MRGKRVIDEEQAALIRRIFTEYATGKSGRAIAHGLNRDGIPSPFGGTWSTSTIIGNRARRSGILWNEAYRGRVVYNRTTFVKDPETGKRLSRPLPSDKWVIKEVPELRIVSDELWKAVQNVKSHYAGLAVQRRRRPRHLFSGLVRCGCCGDAYAIYHLDRLRCVANRDRGTCSNNRTVRMAEIEARVLTGLRDRLLDPDVLAEFLRTYQEERRRLRRDRARQSSNAKARLKIVERALEQAMDTICEGRKSETVLASAFGYARG